MPKFNDLGAISEKNSLIIKEIWLFPNLREISPFIFKAQKITVQF